MSTKKQHRSVCTHHPEKRAQGRCAACGAWLCRECALVVRGVYYCFSPGCRPGELKPPVKEPAAPAAAEQSPPDPLLRTLIFGSSITIALCAAVFAAWALREVWKLHTENAILRTSRLALIEQLKNSNREIGALTPTEGSEPTGGEQPAPAPVLPPQRVRRGSAAPQSAGWLPARATGKNTRHHFANGPADRPTVSLTFDGGSLANIADAVLDTLASRSVTATMFLTGEFIRKYPDLIRRIVAEGHECGNHTFKHPHLTRYAVDRTATTLPSVSEPVLCDQLFRTERIFLTITGTRLAPLWRAPYGEFNREICRWAYEAGYLHIGWRQGRTWREGLDSNDWVPDPETPGYHTPEELIDKVATLARQQPCGINGGILLFHLGTERKKTEDRVHTVLGTLIDTLREKGYRIVPVSRMVASAGIDLASLRERIHIQ
ncbi:MAG: polysaccharide deacetylase family protein [Chitinispirillaceae bacterium]|nr:polysaccharide deacetylase family protein [Chitinispirillaceae bacterium]